MVEFDWFDSPLVKAAAVFLLSLFLAAVLYFFMGSSKSTKEQCDILMRRHLGVMKELEKKIKLRKRNIDRGIPLTEQIKAQNSGSFNSLQEHYYETEKQSSDILQKAVQNFRVGRELEGARYLINACIIWKNDKKVGKLLMALPILEDILIHLSAEDFSLITFNSGYVFADITAVIDYVLSTPLSGEDRKMITDIKKMILMKTFQNF